MVTPHLPRIPDYPPALVAAIAGEAARNADRVGQFLHALGLVPQKGQPPLALPRKFLLGLAAALRLLDWEIQGFHVHLDAGLPSAREALVRVFRAVFAAGSLEYHVDLRRHVLGLFIERFAWNGRAELDADFALGDVNEDELVEALADFLWSQRHALLATPRDENHHEQT